MKRLILVLGIVALLPVGFPAEAYARTEKITLKQLTQKISKENLTVYSNALRVYQAREAIQVARGNLLPKLNLWRLVGSIVDIVMGNYASAFGLIQDLAPFLVPANWFRLQEQKLLYMAEQEGYRALWANEMMTARGLYHHVLLDRSIAQKITEAQVFLNQALIMVRNRETLGGLPPGTSRELEVRSLALLEDQRSLEVLLNEEQSTLTYLMGMPVATELELDPMEIPDLSTLEPLNYADFEYRTVSSSPEVRQFDFFVAAAAYVRREAIYSFLGTTGMSRGVGGGIFDGLPIQDGLGFGTAASMRIVSAQASILRAQQQGVKETLKRHLNLMIQSYNMDLENYSNLRRRVELTKLTEAQHLRNLRLGQEVNILSLVEASRNRIQAETAFLGIQYRFLSNEDRLARLIFHGEYTLRPAYTEALERDRRPGEGELL